MGRVRTDRLRLTGRWLGLDVAAHVPGREPEDPQAPDRQVGEVLAHAALQREHATGGRARIRGRRVEHEIAVQAGEAPGDRLLRWLAATEAGARVLPDRVAAVDTFSCGVAAHPEVHPRSPDRATDRRHLAAKLRLADFAITPFFFEAVHWRRLVDELADLGVDKPVIPGIMPVTDLRQVQRMADMSGAEVPRWLVERLEGAHDAEHARAIGLDAATELCDELLSDGAPGLHVYTLNRPESAKHITAHTRIAQT